MKKIYLVMASGGSWDDAFKYPVNAWKNQPNAEEFCEALQKEADHQHKVLSGADELSQVEASGIKGDPDWRYSAHDPQTYSVYEVDWMDWFDQ